MSVGSTLVRGAEIRFQEAAEKLRLLRGPLLKPDAHRFAAPTTVVGIRLRPGVAYLLTGIATETLVIDGSISGASNRSGISSPSSLVRAHPKSTSRRSSSF